MSDICFTFIFFESSIHFMFECSNAFVDVVYLFMRVVLLDLAFLHFEITVGHGVFNNVDADSALHY